MTRSEEMESDKRKEAYLYEKLPDNKVHCNLCHHRCTIDEGDVGICKVRKNEGGTLYSLVYGKTIAHNVDPIEKKPLFHFFPGSRCLSIATVGCNFKCPWCQNWQISQMVSDHGRIAGEWFPPEDVVSMAQRHKCTSISYTYTEPTIFFEYAYDSAKLATEKGLYNNFVSNGYMTPEAVEMIAPYLNGINVDLKAFDKEVYSKQIKARLDKVLETIQVLHDAGIWLEITTLIVPELNDDEEQLTALAEFIASVDTAIPWHISRFHPNYHHTDSYPTPIDTIRRAREIGKKAGLRYIYTGNVPGDEGEHSHCYKCGALLIERWGFSIRSNNIENGVCPECNTPFDGFGIKVDVEQ